MLENLVLKETALDVLDLPLALKRGTWSARPQAPSARARTCAPAAVRPTTRPPIRPS